MNSISSQVNRIINLLVNNNNTNNNLNQRLVRIKDTNSKIMDNFNINYNTNITIEEQQSKILNFSAKNREDNFKNIIVDILKNLQIECDVNKSDEENLKIISDETKILYQLSQS
jgi:hypothetical protein